MQDEQQPSETTQSQTDTTVQPPVAAPSTAPNSTPQSPKKNKLWAVLLPVIIVLLIAGVAIWFFVIKKSPVAKPAVTNNNSKFSIASFTAYSKQLATTDYAANLEKSSTYGIDTLWESAIGYKSSVVVPATVIIDQYSSKTTKDKNNFEGSSDIDRAAVDAYYQKLVDKLKANQIKLEETNSSAGSGPSSSRQARFTAENQNCTLTEETGDAPNKQYIFGNCAKVSDIAAATETFKPFLKALENNPKAEQLAIEKVNDIQKSATPGYEYVTVRGSYLLYFYRQVGGDWIYVGNFGAAPICSELQTDSGSTKAFKGYVDSNDKTCS